MSLILTSPIKGSIWVSVSAEAVREQCQVLLQIIWTTVQIWKSVWSLVQVAVKSRLNYSSDRLSCYQIQDLNYIRFCLHISRFGCQKTLFLLWNWTNLLDWVVKWRRQFRSLQEKIVGLFFRYSKNSRTIFFRASPESLTFQKFSAEMTQIEPLLGGPIFRI